MNRTLQAVTDYVTYKPLDLETPGQYSYFQKADFEAQHVIEGAVSGLVYAGYAAAYLQDPVVMLGALYTIPMGFLGARVASTLAFFGAAGFHGSKHAKAIGAAAKTVSLAGAIAAPILAANMFDCSPSDIKERREAKEHQVGMHDDFIQNGTALVAADDKTITWKDARSLTLK